MMGSAGASPAVSCAPRDTIRTRARHTDIGPVVGFRAGRKTQRARRPRSPEVVAPFSFSTKGNNRINTRGPAGWEPASEKRNCGNKRRN